MGILNFFTTILRNPTTQGSVSTFVQKMNRKNIDNLFIDFNSLIHKASQEILRDINECITDIIDGYLSIDESSKSQRYGYLFKGNKLAINQKQTQTKKQYKKQICKKIYELFQDDYIDDLIIQKTIDDLNFILKTFTNLQFLKNVYIMMDGVPSKAKMIEQRQRKYGGEFINQIQQTIKNKHITDLEKNERFDIIYQVIWNRNKITPGTIFMQNLCKQLDVYFQNFYQINDKLLQRLKQKDQNTQQNQISFYFSSYEEPGEGEFKIIKFIKQKLINTTQSIMILSPDADMILLGLTIHIFGNLCILRYDQQKDIYNIIDIVMLKQNIYEYIASKISENYKKYIHLLKQFTNDIATIFLLFGNDFIPRLTTIDIQKNLDTFLDSYIDTFNYFKNNKQLLFLVNEKINNNQGVTYQLDKKFLQKFLDFIKKYEDDFISLNQYYMKYRYFYKLRQLFQTSSSNFNIADLKQKTNQFINQYKELKICIQKQTNNQSKSGQNNQMQQYMQDTEFLSKLQQSLQVRIPLNQLIHYLQQNYEKNNNFPKLIWDLSLIYPKRISKERDYPNMNKYEKEMYKFENSLPPFQSVIVSDNIVINNENLNTYYQNYVLMFQKQQNPDLLQDIVYICDNYIKGLMWVFDQYFNINNYDTYNPFYYKYERSPLIRDLQIFVQQLSDSDFQKLIPQYNTKQIKIYPIQQLLYVTPPNYIELIPSDYRQLYKKLQKGFPQIIIDYNEFLNIFINIIKNNKKIQQLVIDQRGIPYLNKAIFPFIEKPTEQQDLQFFTQSLQN